MLRYCKFIFFLIAISNSFAQELTVTQKFPDSAIPGGDYIVETTVNKSSITGFMKFFQAVPAGCIAKEMESKGGSFSFDDGGAKIIWIAPPAEDQFTIIYQVIIPKGVEGVKNINGKFAYLLNSERKVYDLETKTIKIGNEVLMGKTETVLVTGSDHTIITATPVLSPKEEDLAPSRIVEDTISKKENAQIIPEPKKEEEKIVPSAPIVETPVVTEQPASVSVPVKEETKIIEPLPVVIAKEEEKLPPAESIKKEEEKPLTINLPAKPNIPVTAIPSSLGKTFRVQIGAFNLKPKIEGVSDLTTVLLDNGMTKYFSGNFKTYEEAAKRKKQLIEKGFQGAFVVSFENGKMVK